MTSAGTTLPMRPRAGLLSLRELADRCELHPELIRRFVGFGLLDPAEEFGGECYFTPEVSVRALRIVRLHHDLHVNYAGIGLVLDLLERLEALELRLRALDEGG